MLSTTDPFRIVLGRAPPERFRDFIQAAAARHGLRAFQIFATPTGVECGLSTIYDDASRFRTAMEQFGADALAMLNEGLAVERGATINVAINGGTFNQSPLAVGGGDVRQVSTATASNGAEALLRELRQHVQAVAVPEQDKADAVEAVNGLERASSPDQRRRWFGLLEGITTVASKLPPELYAKVGEWVAGRIPG